MKQYYITLAVITAKPGKANELCGELLKLIDPTRNEPGCIEYTLFKKQKEDNVFYMREAFLNEEAFNAHIATTHFQAFAEKVKDLMEPLELIQLEQISH